eukprot:6199912-Pleurochrysis_carterae.AAC.2
MASAHAAYFHVPSRAMLVTRGSISASTLALFSDRPAKRSVWEDSYMHARRSDHNKYLKTHVG